MAVKLNLLPQDYTVSDSVATVLKVTRPLNVILLAIFLVGALGMAVYFIFSSLTIKNLNSKANTLKSQIAAQGTAQQQVVLLKDRLGKIKKVFTKPNAVKNLSAIDPILSSLPGTTSVSELDVDPQKTTLTLNFKSNLDLTNFMTSIGSQDNFSTITMDTFNYNPKTGYLVAFSFVNKVN